MYSSHKKANKIAIAKNRLLLCKLYAFNVWKDSLRWIYKFCEPFFGWLIHRIISLDVEAAAAAALTTLADHILKQWRVYWVLLSIHQPPPKPNGYPLAQVSSSLCGQHGRDDTIHRTRGRTDSPVGADSNAISPSSQRHFRNEQLTSTAAVAARSDARLVLWIVQCLVQFCTICTMVADAIILMAWHFVDRMKAGTFTRQGRHSLFISIMAVWRLLAFCAVLIAADGVRSVCVCARSMRTNGERIKYFG